MKNLLICQNNREKTIDDFIFRLHKYRNKDMRFTSIWLKKQKQYNRLKRFPFNYSKYKYISVIFNYIHMFNVRVYFIVETYRYWKDRTANIKYVSIDKILSLIYVMSLMIYDSKKQVWYIKYLTTSQDIVLEVTTAMATRPVENLWIYRNYY
jgi:hypothetical protein